MTPVFAATFQTTLTLDSPGGTPLVDTIVFEWSTDLTSGTVTETDLTNWSYELFGSGSSVYSETVVLNGVVQPIGGASRLIDDLAFSFDLDTLTLGFFDNDQFIAQSTSTGYLLRSQANKKQLLEALENVKQRKVVTVDLDEYVRV